MTSVTSLREQICATGRSLFNRRLTPGSSGNISVKCEHGWLVTPTNSSLGDLDPGSLSHMAIDGHQLSGKPPSKEWFFHRACYEARGTIGAVVHLHSTHAAAVSCLANLDPDNCFPPLTAYQVMRLGAVPVIPFFRPGDQALGSAVGGLIRRHAAVLLANHGPVVVGKTLEAALNAAEELEETATLFLFATRSEKEPAHAATDSRSSRAFSAGSSAGYHMMKFAANLSFLFGEVPFLDRFERAAAAGFRGVEYLFPYEYLSQEIAERLRSNNLTQVLFNAPPGNWAAGDRGLAAVAGRKQEFRKSISSALYYAKRTGVRQIHVMAGLAPSSDPKARKTYLVNLEYAARQFAAEGLTLLIEPINGRDMPGYFLSSFDDALGILRELDADNVRLQFDIYHRQILSGDVTIALRECFDVIGHIQIASVPDRHEPDTGELSFSHILSLLETLGYNGWIGCEYRPAAETEGGLAWYRRLAASPPAINNHAI